MFVLTLNMLWKYVWVYYVMNTVPCDALWWLIEVSALSAWLAAYEHPVVDRINQRIEDITGLDVKTAEELQVEFIFKAQKR